MTVNNNTQNCTFEHCTLEGNTEFNGSIRFHQNYKYETAHVHIFKFEHVHVENAKN